MNRLLLLVLIVTGCAPSEGGVEFKYALYRDSNPPSPAVDCASIGVSSIRFEVGDDDNSDGLLQEDEAEGRAVVDCNQRDRDQNGTLVNDEIGRYETASDRLPVGEYDLFCVSLAPGLDLFESARYFTLTNYAERWSFDAPGAGSNGPAVVINEGAITHVDFSGYDGNFPELRFIVR